MCVVIHLLKEINRGNQIENSEIRSHAIESAVQSVQIRLFSINKHLNNLLKSVGT